jgi:hypothetical protein
VLYHLPDQHPPITLIGPDDHGFWTRIGVTAADRYALVLGDPAAPTAATVIVGTRADLHRYLDPLDAGIQRDLLPVLLQVRAGLTAADWDYLQQRRPEPDRPVPVPPDVELFTLPHTGLRVPHIRLSVTRYRELPTVDGVAFTATLLHDGVPVGTIQNEGVGGATALHPNGTGGFGWRDLAAYAELARTEAGYRTTEDSVLDDLVTETLTAEHIQHTTGAGRAALRLLVLIGAGGDWLELDHAEATPPRTSTDRLRLIDDLRTRRPVASDQWWQIWTDNQWHDLTPRPQPDPEGHHR